MTSSEVPLSAWYGTPAAMGKRKREKQTRLTLNPLPSSSPASSGYNQQIRDRAAAVALQGASPLSRKSQRLDVPAAGSSPLKSLSSRRDAGPCSSRKKQKVLDFTNAPAPGSLGPLIDLTSSAAPPSSISAGVFSSQVRPGRDELYSDEDSSGDDLPVLPKSGAKAIAAEPVIRIRDDDEEEEDDDDDDDDVIRSSIRTPGKRNLRASQRPITLESSDEEVDVGRGGSRKKTTKPAVSQLQSDLSDDDDELVSITPRRRGRRGRGDATQSDEQADSDDDPAPNASRQRGRLKTWTRVTSEEQADLEEDLEFLQPSSDSETAFRIPPSTQSVQKNARLEALQRLKRKRAGQVEPEIIEEKPEPLSITDDDESEDGIGQGHVPPSSRQYFTETKDDEDFIEKEDDNIIGIQNAMPIEFTQYARMRPKELFRFIVEWMVQKKINPAFERSDELYKLAFAKVDDEATGLAGSKFRSSAWTPRFSMTLQARPEIEYEHMGGAEWAHDRCDACNRSGHPATFELRFSGKPYHVNTLEDVGNEDDEGSDSSDDDDDIDSVSLANRDAKGREIDPVDTVYYVGKFCMANAKTAHALEHWRYHLYDWVETWLVRNGYDAPDKIIKRDKMSTRKRRKHANKIVDSMDEKGVIKQLWHQFKQSTSEARDAKQGGRYGFNSSP